MSLLLFSVIIDRVFILNDAVHLTAIFTLLFDDVTCL